MFFSNDTPTTEIYTLSLHDALPISPITSVLVNGPALQQRRLWHSPTTVCGGMPEPSLDRKSTRLNSSHANISYAVFCLKKKNALSASSDTINTPAIQPPPHSANRSP